MVKVVRDEATLNANVTLTIVNVSDGEQYQYFGIEAIFEIKINGTLISQQLLTGAEVDRLREVLAKERIL